MSKFYGEVGYSEQIETSPGVWEEVITERKYFGDVIRNVTRMQPSEHLNDNLNADNRLSIVADPFAYENFSKMRYVSWLGELWKIASVDVQRPRLVLTVSGVYNGKTTRIS